MKIIGLMLFFITIVHSMEQSLWNLQKGINPQLLHKRSTPEDERPLPSASNQALIVQAQRVLVQQNRCQQCLLLFENLHSLADHQIKYWDKHFSCHQCAQIFISSFDLQTHICPKKIAIKKASIEAKRPKKETPKATKEKIEKQENYKDYLCLCGKELDTYPQLTVHQRTCAVYKDW